MATYANLSAGSWVKWAASADTAGTRPTTGYVALKGVTAVPSFGDQPGVLDVTAINNTNRVYIFDLPDSGGVIALTVNDATEFRESFEAMKTAYDTAAAAGKAFWIEYAYPPESGIDSFYYPAAVHELGFGGFEVGAALGNSVSIAPAGDFEYAAAST